MGSRKNSRRKLAWFCSVQRQSSHKYNVTDSQINHVFVSRRHRNTLAEQHSYVTLLTREQMYLFCASLLCVDVHMASACVRLIVMTSKLRSDWRARTDVQIESPFLPHSIILPDCLLVSCFLWEVLILLSKTRRAGLTSCSALKLQVCC